MKENTKHYIQKDSTTQQLSSNCTDGTPSNHAGGLWANRSRKHAGTARAGWSRDSGAGRRPVEGFYDGDMDAACGTRLFLPQPLLHALKTHREACYYPRRIHFSDRPSLLVDMDFLYWRQEAIGPTWMFYSKHVHSTLNSDPNTRLQGQQCCVCWILNPTFGFSSHLKTLNIQFLGTFQIFTRDHNYMITLLQHVTLYHVSAIRC